MNPREALEKMLKWVEDEIKKAKLPLKDPFTLISLSFCTDKVFGQPEGQEILALLRAAVAAERQVGTYDVVTPNQAIFLINRALATLP